MGSGSPGSHPFGSGAIASFWCHIIPWVTAVARLALVHAHHIHGGAVAGHGVFGPGHFIKERLKVSTRWIQEHVKLDRFCFEMPELREEYRSGEVSFERARLVARVANRAL